jgi:putative tricarboxylic transport membrane protein
VIGVLLGIMPALGLSSANVVAYMAERRWSKNPETFGTGNPAGLLAPEVAKSACIVGDLIPTFTLGIPGSSTTALFLAAMTLHGIQPGAAFFNSGTMPYAIFTGILLAQFAFFIIGLLFAGTIARVVMMPNSLLVPLITILCFVGSFAARNSMLDVMLTMVFGVIGYFLTKREWPAAPFVLGFILANMAESNFHRAMLIAGGSAIGLVSSPISLSLAIATVLLLAWPMVSSLFQRSPSR